ncbi:MAG: hypothetical protein K9M49_00680 [Candidatus Marinimicrobia bacterium]|nr:hypothetical protein [Candidatus Neomarinimicrobiota bacterium]MCF7850623.1 hypothetical protein [Candidatus Neomarinimicrobiota bacterium]MCF7903643.1 hypothetical protein [Candidatus Neomarinimicrobiota bacterium]
MKTLTVLLKREWLEWKRVVLGTIIVITFLNFLMLLSVARGSSWFHETMARDGSILMKDVQISDDEVGNLEIIQEDGQLQIYYERENESHDVDEFLTEAAKPMVYGMRFGMQGIFLFVLFLSLFYFSDAIYKERADNSTLFFRSLPVNDHYLLGSKILAGLLGVIGLTLLLSLEYLLFIRVAFMIWGAPLDTMLSALFEKISYLGIIWDWFSYLLFAAIRMAPLALFLMLVGAYVKGRPLLIGIGGPLLLSISWAIVFKSAALFKIIGKFFWGFNLVMIEQWHLLEDKFQTEDVIYANPWDYILNVDTLAALLASGVLYYALWKVYRKNIPTG